MFNLSVQEEEEEEEEPQPLKFQAGSFQFNLSVQEEETQQQPPPQPPLKFQVEPCQVVQCHREEAYRAAINSIRTGTANSAPQKCRPP